MRIASDAIGQEHDLDETRERMVSLVPSTTETVCRIGAEDRLLAVTRYCVHPPGVRDRHEVVGGTKSPKIDAILALHPDLVLANREENRREDIERLMTAVPVFVFYPRDVDAAVADIRVLGNLVDRIEPAASIASAIVAKREALAHAEAWERFRYLYFIWQNPHMVAGHGTFVAALLAEIGGYNAAPEGASYPEMSAPEIEAANADVLLLSSEPFPFSPAHVTSMRERVDAPALLVDGELLSWHGARLVESFDYLSELAISIARARAR